MVLGDELLDLVAVGGEEDVGDDGHFGDAGVGVEDHERAVAWAALVEESAGFAGQFADLFPGIGDGHLERAIQDQAERAVFAVLDKEDDGAEEIGVEEFWRGDEKLALE